MVRTAKEKERNYAYWTKYERKCNSIVASYHFSVQSNIHSEKSTRYVERNAWRKREEKYRTGNENWKCKKASRK